MTRMFRTFCCMVCLAAAPAGACEAEKRLQYGVPVEIAGVLAAGTGEHEAQGQFAYSYLELDAPVCVDADPANEFEQATEKPVTRVQLAGDKAGEALPLGARVTATGTLFGAHTMWHVEDVLIDATQIAPR